MNKSLREALAFGDPQEVADIISAGADLHYQAEGGYDAFIDAVHGREILHDSRLIELLTLLINSGVSLTGMSDYGESAVRVLSRMGRFDAVQLLLEAGASPDDLEMTGLVSAVAFGSLADVAEVVGKGADLEALEYWERTAWLVAVQTGDIPKAKFLLEHGANPAARGRCGKPPLFFAIENHHAPMLEWLLEVGADIDQTDDFGDTALAAAAETDNIEAVEALLRAGADVNQKLRAGDALNHAGTRRVALRLLEAGADPLELSTETRRAILGYPPEPDADLLPVSVTEFREFRSPRFGTRNPEVMNNPFWEGMIRSGLNAYLAAMHIENERSYGAGHDPIWCAQRFGQSITFLDDGRIVQVAGEHEDHYDPDFCIYNDVFVHDPEGNVTIYGYLKSIFPPTDFHTATLIDDYLYLIGSLGYQGARQFGQTPVYRLDMHSFRMERLRTTGDHPGWIYKHRALRLGTHEIQITGGQIVTEGEREGTEIHSGNAAAFVLNIESLVWTVTVNASFLSYEENRSGEGTFPEEEGGAGRR